MLNIIHLQAMKIHVIFGDDKCTAMMVRNKDPSNYGVPMGGGLKHTAESLHLLYIPGINNNTCFNTNHLLFLFVFYMMPNVQFYVYKCYILCMYMRFICMHHSQCWPGISLMRGTYINYI